MIEMASIMIGVAGVAQQLKTANSGGGGSAPTGVAIYNANGGTANTCLAENLNLGSLGEQPVDDLLTTDFGGVPAATMTLNYGGAYSAALNNNGGRLIIRVFGYIEATGATSFAWDADNFTTIQDTGSAVSSWTGIGTASTSQDATSGIGEDAVLQHNSGGRGYLLLQPSNPTNNDAVRWDVEAFATNSSGTTGATKLRITLESQ